MLAHLEKQRSILLPRLVPSCYRHNSPEEAYPEAVVRIASLEEVHNIHSVAAHIDLVHHMVVVAAAIDPAVVAIDQRGLHHNASLAVVAEDMKVVAQQAHHICFDRNLPLCIQSDLRR